MLWFGKLSFIYFFSKKGVYELNFLSQGIYNFLKTGLGLLKASEIRSFCHLALKKTSEQNGTRKQPVSTCGLPLHIANRSS